MAGRDLEEVRRTVDHCRRLVDSEARRAFEAVRWMTEEVRHWRSLEGHYHSSNSRESLEKHRTRSKIRLPEKSEKDAAQSWRDLERVGLL